jgi:hypothetical protein
MPFLMDREIEAMAREYGFIGSDEEEKIGDKTPENVGNASEEKPSADLRGRSRKRNSDRTLQMHDEQEGGFRNY